MKQQMTTMLEMQDAINRRVHDDWRERNHEWYRAIWIECAELLDHYGWKWWKKQSPDRDQVVLELVDIWHFGLSIVLSSHTSVDSAADKMVASFDVDGDIGDFKEDVEQFAETTLSTRGFDVPGYCRLMAGIDLPFDELFRRYVGKNVLNFFRQDHGYQEGTYKKVWNGREDNEHLVDIVSDIDFHSPDIRDLVYSALKARYSRV